MNYFKELLQIFKRTLSNAKEAAFRHKYPRELQFPITYKCNFNCVMCGMNKLVQKEQCNVSQIATILSDKLFKKITNVGINGGEPFLRKDLFELVCVLVDKLPKLKAINIISNGFFTKTIISELAKIKKVCNDHSVLVNLSLSVDGVDKMQKFMRGNALAFQNVSETIKVINSNINNFCDSLNIICTLTRHNIYNVYEVYNWASQNKLNVTYNIATVNKRIENEDMVDDFSIFSDQEAVFMAREFFYRLFRETKSERYYALFLYLLNKKRYSGCSYRYNYGVTLTPDGYLSYCATHSELLGSCLEKSAYKIYTNSQNYHKMIRKTWCDNCSHYTYRLNTNGLIFLHKENNRYRRLALMKKRAQQ